MFPTSSEAVQSNSSCRVDRVSLEPGDTDEDLKR